MLRRIKTFAGFAAGAALLATGWRIIKAPDRSDPETVEGFARFFGIRKLLAYFLGFLALEGIVAVGAVLFIAWLGPYNVAATAGHSALMRWFLHFAMRHSVAWHTSEKPVPPLDDQGMIMLGAAHYRSGCAPCHGAPGELASPISDGMTPPPPGLYSVYRDFTPNELHWIVKHGIKMTAMPAWPAPERGDEIWPIVAFLEKLPAMKPEEYQKLSVGLGETRTRFLTGPDQAGFLATCARCHGPDGHGRGPVPQIAGLSARYIANMLQAFREGSRRSGFMQPIAAKLTDRQIAQAADYFSSRERSPKPVRRQPNPMVLELGRSIADPAHSRGPGPACLTCHLPDSQHRDPSIPTLSGQPQDYIATQLRLFRSGIRSHTPNAKIMERVAKRLSDGEIVAVAAYLAAARSPE